MPKPKLKAPQRAPSVPLEATLAAVTTALFDLDGVRYKLLDLTWTLRREARRQAELVARERRTANRADGPNRGKVRTARIRRPGARARGR